MEGRGDGSLEFGFLLGEVFRLREKTNRGRGRLLGGETREEAGRHFPEN